MSQASSSKPSLRRALGSSFAFAACIGGIIGLGILRTPGEIANVVTDPGLYVGLWVAGGLFALMSVAVVAELVGLAPHSGGAYPLIRRAYGPYAGFLFGWTDWLSFAATLALKVVVLVTYLSMLIPIPESWQVPLALLVISLFGTLQLFSVKLGAGIQQGAAAFMGLTIVAMAIALFMGDAVDLAQVPPATPSLESLEAWGLVAAAIIFTYDGWLGAAYFSSEIKGGGGNVARACVKSVGIILVLYVLLNAALATSVPLSALANQDLALASALELVHGPGAATVVIVAAVLILLAHQNLNFMQGPRILYALSMDGLNHRRASEVGKGGNPVVAVLITWLLSSALVLSGGFEFLLSLTVMLVMVLYMALLYGVVALRRSDPQADRPYRAFGHPFTTIIGLLGWAGLTAFMVISTPGSALSGIAMIAVSLPIYLALKRRATTEGATEPS